MQPVSFYYSMVEGLQAIYVLYLDLFRNLNLFFTSKVEISVVYPPLFIKRVKSNDKIRLGQAHPIDFSNRNVKEVWFSIHNGSLPGIEDTQGGVEFNEIEMLHFLCSEPLNGGWMRRSGQLNRGVPKLLSLHDKSLKIEEEAVHLISRAVAHEFEALPIKLEGNRLTVAVRDVARVPSFEGYEVVPVLAEPGSIFDKIEHYFDVIIETNRIVSPEQLWSVMFLRGDETDVFYLRDRCEVVMSRGPLARDETYNLFTFNLTNRSIEWKEVVDFKVISETTLDRSCTQEQWARFEEHLKVYNDLPRMKEGENYINFDSRVVEQFKDLEGKPSYLKEKLPYTPTNPEWVYHLRAFVFPEFMGENPFVFEGSVDEQIHKWFGTRGKVTRKLVYALLDKYPDAFYYLQILALFSDLGVSYLHPALKEPFLPILSQSRDRAQIQEIFDDLVQWAPRKRLFKCLSNFDFYVWRDLPGMIKKLENRGYPLETYYREKFDVRKVHDAASMAIARLDDKEFKLPVPMDDFTEEGYEFVFPKTNLDLKAWGLSLKNCLASYSHNVEEGKCNILGVCKKHLSYAIEVDRSLEVRQFSGVGNSAPPKEDKDTIMKILKQRILPAIRQKREPVFGD